MFDKLLSVERKFDDLNEMLCDPAMMGDIRRYADISKEIKQLQLAEADLLRQQSEGSKKEQRAAQIIPTAQHILESYPILGTEEKNRLWKLVLKRVPVYRSPEDKLEVNIYPNLTK